MMHESKKSLQHIYAVYEMMPYDVQYVLCMDVYAWWEILYILFFTMMYHVLFIILYYYMSSRYR